MNIFIKSFNRPYYLERCIQSVLQNVVDDKLSIIVLDDGTNPRYLAKIQDKYPNVIIRLSPFYSEKASKIERFISDGIKIKEMEIPTQFWLSSIMECKDKYFLLLEDDFWLTEKMDLNTTIRLMDSNNLCLLKLFCFGNHKLVSGKLLKLSDQINEIIPQLPVNNEFIFKKFVLGNSLKIWSLLSRLNIHNNSVVKYYTIYNVAGAIFSKEYYVQLWKDFSGVVNEDEQLIKALHFFNKNKKVKYGVVNKDVVGTSFSSSATNMFPDINFNPFTYNNILNEAWFNGKFDSMSGYPKDFNSRDIVSILQDNNEKLASVPEWEKWVNRFQNQYREIGFKFDDE